MYTEINKIQKILTHSNKSLCTVESCTGGMIAHIITSKAGVSNFFKGGIIPYSNTIKNSVLNIDEDVLIKNGSVSENVVKEMIQNGLKLFNTDYCIATSGFAGPTGGNKKYPVGTVFIGVGSKDNICINVFHFSGDRTDVIKKASREGLKQLINLL